jgi:putative methyltransferase (TIGR04325 family)
MNELSPLTRIRFKQIRLFSKTIEKLSSHNGGSKLLSTLGSNPLIDHSLSGFRRTFPSFEEARREALKYRVPSHEHPRNVAIHTYRSEEVRPSDYPVLYHMQRLMGEVKSVLDIGGSVGNLFYCYSRYLKYPPGFTWTVFEVPETVAAGSRLSQQRNEHRLRFVDRIPESDTADVVVISGALHYFEELPPDLTRTLRRQPRHIFINRTPVIDGPTAITIQDHEQYFAISPARILSRATLFEAMTAAGYELVDEWKAHELRLRVPLHPEASVSAYSGFYFRMKQEGETPYRRQRKTIPRRVRTHDRITTRRKEDLPQSN